jgi:RNA polymerase sigma-70 factor, ECF subfamily
MSHTDLTSQFAEQLVTIQKELYAYILTLLPCADEASDVLQQTNLVLWRDVAKFQAGTNYRAWAYRVAYFQVLAQRRKTTRDHLRFNDDFLEQLAEHAAHDAHLADDEASDLRECLKGLSDDERELIRRRYDAGVTVKVIADDLCQSSNTIAVRLHRIRRMLLDCIGRHSSERNQG